MSHSIAQRICDFLMLHLPFRFMAEADVYEIAKQSIIIYKAKEEIVFDQGAATHPQFYVVKEGAVHLFRIESANYLLVDTCDEGDILGLRPLIADQVYGLQAKAIEPSLLYGISLQEFRPFLAKYPAVSFYLAKIFAKGVHNNYEDTYRNALYFQNTELAEPDLMEVQQLKPHRSPVICQSDVPIQKAALTMKKEEVSSIVIINDQKHPIGIITDKDLRKQVATGRVSINVPIGEIMSKPVLTVKENLSLAEAQISMIKNQIHHLVQTVDGTPKTAITGLVTEHDLLVLQANNPAALIRRIRHSQTREDLKNVLEISEQLLSKYLDQRVSMDFIAAIRKEINDSLLVQTIRFQEQVLQSENWKLPSGTYCWLSLGSGGREEQLLKTDQDNALVFVANDGQSPAEVKKYYLALAQKVSAELHYYGFDFCPAEMMASNPKWCLSMADWKAQFAKWIAEPGGEEILMSSIFFDFRPIYGEEALADELRQFILAQIKKRTSFLNFLAKDALHNPPPLSFFRNFVVEKGGEHLATFDIKARAMMPLADAARVLALSTLKITETSTVARFKALAKLEPHNEGLFHQAAEAYQILMRFRAKFGLINQDSGRFIDPKALSKMERLQLRNSFQPIRALQSLLSTRFNLAFLM